MNEAPPLIEAGEAALLVMDFQAGILERLPGASELLGRAREAIALVRGHGGRIAYVRVAFTDADYEGFPSTSSMGRRVASAGRAFHADSPTTAIAPEIAPQEGDIVVRKTRVGAFSTTDLQEQLHARGVSTLILAGLSTSGVVLSTVRDATDRDYRVLVLSDVCADPEPGVHEFLTESIFPRQAEVITLGQLEGQFSG